MEKDEAIMILQNIRLYIFSRSVVPPATCENSVYAFMSIRAILAEGLKLFLRLIRCSDRDVTLGIHANGKTE